MAATGNSTDSTSAAPSTAGHTPRFPDQHAERFAQCSSIPEIVRTLLGDLKEGADAKISADAILVKTLFVERSREQPDHSMIAVLRGVTEILEPRGWAYSIEDGLKRIAELGRLAPGAVAGGRKDPVDIATTISSAEDYTAEMREAFQAIEEHAMRFDSASSAKDRTVCLTSLLALVERGLTRADAMKDAIGSIGRLVKGGAQ